jgi:Ca-activated chloride channel homolog
MFLQFAYQNVIYIFLPILLFLLLYRLRFYKHPRYTFPLAQYLAQHGFMKKTYHKKVLFILRGLMLLGLIFLIARPQWADERSKVNVEGIDIILAIDVSGSMQLQDDPKDQRTRIDVAKSEAIRFIEKRTDDPVGIVLFGKEVISRCPLTLDKQILKEIVGSIELGVLDYQGTWLGTGLATAVNRLKNSHAKSKIIILLTDGNPTPDEKIEPTLAVDLAKKFGIKVYTIGIGSDDGAIFQHPLHGPIRIPEEKLNTQLLSSIAEKTGGKFFRAKSPQEMRNAYDIIDRLEKTKIETNVFHRYYEAFASFIWIILLLFGIEITLRFFVWRGISQ